MHTHLDAVSLHITSYLQVQQQVAINRKVDGLGGTWTNSHSLGLCKWYEVSTASNALISMRHARVRDNRVVAMNLTFDGNCLRAHKTRSYAVI